MTGKVVSMDGRRVVTPPDLEGWDAITCHLKVSEVTARKWAARKEDPLPVLRFMGRIRARSADLDQWVERHTTAFGGGE